jgi:hypothetical protein
MNLLFTFTHVVATIRLILKNTEIIAYLRVPHRGVKPVISDEAVEAAAKEIDAPSEPAAQEIARRALEAAAPYLQPLVSTQEDLDALPRFTVIRDYDGLVFERQTMWHEAGSRDLKYSPDVSLPVSVLQLGWGAA